MLTKQDREPPLIETKVYTPWGYGDLIEKNDRRSVVKFTWGGTGYVDPISITNSISFQVKLFSKDRQLLNFDWNITHDFSNLFIQLKRQLNLSAGTFIKLIYPMASMKEICSSDSPYSLKIKKNTKFIALLRQNFYWNEIRKAANLEISNSGLTALKKTEDEFETVLANIKLISGSYSWEIKVDLLVDDDDIFIGVADINISLTGHPPDTGLFWGFRCSGGKKFRPDSGMEDYGENVGTGDVVGIRLEYNGDNGSLSFLKNGKDFGVAYTNVPPNLHPAISLFYQRTQVTLVCKN